MFTIHSQGLQTGIFARQTVVGRRADTTPHAVLQRLPGFLQAFISLLVAAGVYSIDNAPNHVLVNSYGPSGAIPPHTDGEPPSACVQAYRANLAAALLLLCRASLSRAACKYWLAANFATMYQAHAPEPVHTA